MKSHSTELIEKVQAGKENPFHTIESIGEHINACWSALYKEGYQVWENQSSSTQRPRGKPGDITYHLRTIDEYQQQLFGVMAALLPMLYSWSEGRIKPDELVKLQRDLSELAKWHQERYNAYHESDSR